MTRPCFGTKVLVRQATLLDVGMDINAMNVADIDRFEPLLAVAVAHGADEPIACSVVQRVCLPVISVR